MKKIIAIIALAVSLICLSSCTKDTFSIVPTSMTISVGELQNFKINTGGVDTSKGELGTTIVEGEDFIALNGCLVQGIAPGKAVVVAFYRPEGAEKATHTASITITVK